LSSPYLFDANAVSDAMKGQPNLVAKVAAKHGSVVTSVIVKGEIHYGLTACHLENAAPLWKPRLLPFSAP
jgi:predicted nucleic acid-binding protein